MDRVSQASTASWISFIAGLWLIASPYIWRYPIGSARTNDIISGIIVAIIGITRATNPGRFMWLSWVNVIMAIWLIIAPFVLSYGLRTPTWNDVILGVIIGAFSIWSGGISTAGGRAARA